MQHSWRDGERMRTELLISNFNPANIQIGGKSQINWLIPVLIIALVIIVGFSIYFLTKPAKQPPTK